MIARNREHEEIDMITSIFPTICADDVAATRDFYVELFDFRVVFDSGWYAQLEASDGAKPQIGIVEREHETVPAAFRRIRPVSSSPSKSMTSTRCTPGPKQHGSRCPSTCAARPSGSATS